MYSIPSASGRKRLKEPLPFLSFMLQSVPRSPGHLPTQFPNAAGMSVTVMAVVQRAVFSTFLPIKPEATDVIAYEAWKMGLESGNAIQLGLDIVWDIFILIGMVLLAISMYSHPRLGKIISIIGITIGLLGLYFNLSTFPTPPAGAGSFDMGPLVGLWFLAVTIMVIARLKWMRHSLEIEGSE